MDVAWVLQFYWTSEAVLEKKSGIPWKKIPFQKYERLSTDSFWVIRDFRSREPQLSYTEARARLHFSYFPIPFDQNCEVKLF